jgi:hypothetical protein
MQGKGNKKLRKVDKMTGRERSRLTVARSQADIARLQNETGTN